jgi:hypothetical protein
MAARTFASSPQLDSDNTNATAILEYTDAPPSAAPPDFPNLPAVDDIAEASAYAAQLRSLVTSDHPVDVPTHVDEHMLVTIAIMAREVFPLGSAPLCSFAWDRSSARRRDDRLTQHGMHIPVIAASVNGDAAWQEEARRGSDGHGLLCPPLVGFLMRTCQRPLPKHPAIKSLENLELNEQQITQDYSEKQFHSFVKKEYDNFF